MSTPITPRNLTHRSRPAPTQHHLNPQQPQQQEHHLPKETPRQRCQKYKRHVTHHINRQRTLLNAIEAIRTSARTTTDLTEQRKLEMKLEIEHLERQLKTSKEEVAELMKENITLLRAVRATYAETVPKKVRHAFQPIGRNVFMGFPGVDLGQKED